MRAALFQPSAWARSWLQDAQAPTEMLARDPIMSMKDKLWVLRHRAGVHRAPAAIWSAEHHARLEQGG